MKSLRVITCNWTRMFLRTKVSTTIKSPWTPFILTYWAKKIAWRKCWSFVRTEVNQQLRRMSWIRCWTLNRLEEKNCSICPLLCSKTTESISLAMPTFQLKIWLIPSNSLIQSQEPMIEDRRKHCWIEPCSYMEPHTVRERTASLVNSS